MNSTKTNTAATLEDSRPFYLDKPEARIFLVASQLLDAFVEAEVIELWEPS